MNAIATFIKNSRLCLNLTQTELGDKLFKSQKTISAWEKGERTPSKRIIDAIKNMLNEETDE